MAAPEVSRDEFFVGHPEAASVHDVIRTLLASAGAYDVRITKSQVAYRRRRAFAFLWLPDRYLRHPTAPAVVSIALERPDRSARFKEIVEVAPGRWMHHLEVHGPEDLDDEVAAWLTEAAAAAS